MACKEVSWDTKETSLWLNNDEDLYNISQGKSAEEIEGFCRDNWTNPSDVDLDNVDWDEVERDCEL